MLHDPAPHPLELSGLPTALLILHHRSQHSHAPLLKGMGSGRCLPSFINLPFTSVKTNVPIWCAGDLQHITESNETAHVFEGKEQN